MFVWLTDSGLLSRIVVESKDYAEISMLNRFNMELGGRIRARRERTMTQAALAKAVGLSRTSITNIECGRQRLLVDQLADIASALGVPVADLIPSSPSQAEEPTVPHPELPQMPTVARWLNAARDAAG